MPKQNFWVCLWFLTEYKETKQMLAITGKAELTETKCYK